MYIVMLHVYVHIHTINFMYLWLTCIRDVISANWQ